MATLMDTIRGNRTSLFGAFALMLMFALSAPALALEPLLVPIGAPATRHLPDHLVASQRVKVNPRALQSPVISIELMGETVVAIRDRERRDRGTRVWVGHVEGRAMDRVIVTSRGRQYSALIQNGERSYQLGLDRDGQNRLDEWMLDMLPEDDAAEPPSGGGELLSAPATAIDSSGQVRHDLLVVYTQPACSFAGSCAQLEADIVTAVTDLNAAYEESGIGVRVNIVGTAKTPYEGLYAGVALEHLAGENDGYMDEVHGLRDALGADIVSLVYSGEGCGIGYLNASAERAFNVTDVPCMLANRTLAHEIAHNQGANHDRVTLGTPSVTTYNYGYRRCDDSSLPDFAPAPHFRTIMSYSCGSVPRRGIFSSPDEYFDGVVQGVDPLAAPSRGTDNARRINERAEIVAAFRSTVDLSPPEAPAALAATAMGTDVIRLDWADRAIDERAYVVQSSVNGESWSTLANLPANSESWSHGGLPAGSTRLYRVYATNAAGGSGFSRVVSATTQEVPGFEDDYPLGERPIAGSVHGDLQSIRNGRDGRYLALSEEMQGRGKKRGYGTYGHVWEFQVSGGAGGSVAMIRAWVSGDEGAAFWYSTDAGATRQPMLIVNANAPEAGQAFVLPLGISGRVWIGVNDAEQAEGEALDSVYVDEVVIRSWERTGSAPAAPIGLQAIGVSAASVALAFQDASEVEWGFTIWRQSDPRGSCQRGRIVGATGAADGEVAFTDVTASPARDYWYSITAFNGAGESACSDAVKVTTPAGSEIELTSLETYRVKGLQQVDLAWAAKGPVDIYRDGDLLRESFDGASMTDAIGVRGQGRYEYRVCQAATAICSDSRTAEF